MTKHKSNQEDFTSTVWTQFTYTGASSDNTEVQHDDFPVGALRVSSLVYSQKALVSVVSMLKLYIKLSMKHINVVQYIKCQCTIVEDCVRPKVSRL